MEIWPGRLYPLGATWDGHGVNFAIFSENAEAVELCLFEPLADGGREVARGELTEKTAGIRHGYVHGLGPGQRYGYRVYGPYDPASGHRFNPAKLLLDPYGKAIEGELAWRDEVFGYRMDSEEKDLSLDSRDSAPWMPRSVVVDPSHEWENQRRPDIPWHDTVIYETHVKGMTARHPEVPFSLRGTYLGMAHPAVLEHLKSLGVTAVELMPVHHFLDDRRLVENGLRNYWGYNTLSYFAPEPRYASGGDPLDPVREFKDMVKALHQAGIEVIVDVVYNHTAEGNHLGPTLSYRGIDNASYYRLEEDDPRQYTDYTGTGNTLNLLHPRVVQLIMDSLRYWVLEMGVDGFRFDLAAALARELYDVNMLSPFFQIIQQDPVLAETKLIAEPWDVGPGGYQVGNFPPGWAEWNGKYRDTVRDYWRGGEAGLGEFALRLTGSPDLYEGSQRRPRASVNFVTAHDGFTLNDLVSYNEKHNEANKEGNADGDDHNRSWNHGVEGPTKDPDVAALRARQKRNFLTTLLCSQGVPMLLGGDEIGRTQSGNNNAYCQDNEISWFDWEAVDEDLLAFTRRIVAFRRDHAAFRRRRWFQGRAIHGTEKGDVCWFRPDGMEMTQEDWDTGFAKALAVFVNGEAIPDPGPRGEWVLDDTFFLLFNAGAEPMSFVLPPESWGAAWQPVLDTTDPQGRPRSQGVGSAADGGNEEGGAHTGGEPSPDGRDDGEGLVAAGGRVEVAGRAILVLERVDEGRAS